MKLYYSKGACSLAVRIILNELNVNAEYEAVNLKTKQTASGSDFLAVNAKGAVPTLQLNDGSILTENAVILQYLADTQGNGKLLAAVGKLERYHCLEWVNYITTELHKSFGLLFKPTVSDDTKNKFAKPELEKKFHYVDQAVGEKPFLMGDKFSLPDAYLFVMLQWAKAFHFDFNQWPNLARYHAQLMVYPSVAKSLDQEK